MSTFKYNITYLAPMGASKNQKAMNKLGADGWDIFRMERSVDGGLILYSKKELPGKYAIPQEEYDYIETLEQVQNYCSLCNYGGGYHHPTCVLHEDNIEESGADYCAICGWIFHDEHKNEYCESYVEEEENEV